MRKAIVRELDGFVTNVIEIEEDAKYSPPEGTYLIEAELSGSTGDTWDGKVSITPEIIPVPKPRDLAAEIDEIKARLDKEGI